MKICCPAMTFLLLLAVAPIPAVASAEAEDDDGETRALEIFGWVERVELLDGELSMKAKLDTGALNSSLHALEIQRFRREGKRYVRFTVTDPETAEPKELEKRLVRNVRIVRHNGEYQRRPVVEMDICLGPYRRVVEVNLVDRSELIYPLLLGRTALKGVALVDAADTFQNYPACDDESGE